MPVKRKARRKIQKRARAGKKPVKNTVKKVIAPKIERPIIKSKFNKKDLAGFKKILIALRSSLLSEIEAIAKGNLKTSQRDASGDLSGYSLHMADMASDNYDREFSLGIASSEQRAIYEIDEAMKRIEEGVYGICLSCDKHIKKSRLKAVPHAKHCIECQEKEELLERRGVR